MIEREILHDLHLSVPHVANGDGSRGRLAIDEVLQNVEVRSELRVGGIVDETNSSRPAWLPYAGTHSVTRKRSLPWRTITSLERMDGMRFPSSTLAVTVVVTWTSSAVAKVAAWEEGTAQAWPCRKFTSDSYIAKNWHAIRALPLRG
jgi:hypothetical protein